VVLAPKLDLPGRALPWRFWALNNLRIRAFWRYFLLASWSAIVLSGGDWFLGRAACWMTRGLFWWRIGRLGPPSGQARERIAKEADYVHNRKHQHSIPWTVTGLQTRVASVGQGPVVALLIHGLASNLVYLAQADGWLLAKRRLFALIAPDICPALARPTRCHLSRLTNLCASATSCVPVLTPGQQ